VVDARLVRRLFRGGRRHRAIAGGGAFLIRREEIRRADAAPFLLAFGRKRIEPVDIVVEAKRTEGLRQPLLGAYFNSRSLLDAD
jgi:hypothetical protein